MKIVGFHLMPYRHLPSDFEHRYRSVCVDIPPGLFDPERGAAAYHEYLTTVGFWLDDAPIPDFFVMTPPESREVLFHDARSPLALMMLPDTPPPPEVLLEVIGAYASSAKLLWPLPSDPALLKRLHRLTMPTLVLWGASDRLVPPAHARAWERALADVRVVILPESGHLPMYEQPEAWVREVLEFGGKITAAMASA